MTALTVDLIRSCLEGIVPAVMATCDAQGTPNVSLISQVHYVDGGRVALSYQFFNKTRRNILATGEASVAVMDPVTLASYRLALEFEETQTSGSLFESMKAKLSGIASHTGMQDVFRLLGADVFRVREIEAIPGGALPAPPPERNLLSATRRLCAEMSACIELEELLERTLSGLQHSFGIEHVMALMLDRTAGRLYTIASRGYAASGVGSEIALGEGIVGVAVRERTPIRIGHMTSEYRYGAAIRDSARRAGFDGDAAPEIPFPGLAAPRSQIALPIQRSGRVIGALLAESERTMRFCYDDEDALMVVADHLGALMDALGDGGASPQLDATAAAAQATDEPTMVRHYAFDDSVFIGEDYIIKGVAGAILWRLLGDHERTGRTEFATRELRLDPVLRLPEHAENLDARLILLRKRLAERGCPVRLEKCGRGRLRLSTTCKLSLAEVGANGPAHSA